MSGCKAAASWVVAFELRDRNGHSSILIDRKLICCSACRREMTVRDVVSRDVFHQMRRTVQRRDGFVAEMSKTRLKFVSLSDPFLFQSR